MKIEKSLEERAKKLGVPIIPSNKIDEKQPFDTNPVVAICGNCGTEWRRVMYYSCNQINCPMQNKIIL